MAQTPIEAAEEASYEHGDFQDVPPADIVAYNELRSCADLYRMFDDGSLDISPSFQREVAWKGPAQTRFIDSLIKQLPIPSLCFSYDYKNEEWQVIDGLQRISSIVKFLNDKSDWVLASLEDIDPRISAKPVLDFHNKKNTDLYKLRRRVENATLPITVIRCDPSLETHSNYIFTIFHRLNTGGLKLNNQEIRNCIFSGNFNELLRQLEQEQNWLALNGLAQATNARFKRQEVILRFFAFYEGFENYKEGLAKFLNNYMRVRRNLTPAELQQKSSIFSRTVGVVNSALGNEFEKERPNLTVLEALLVGVARNIDVNEARNAAEITEKFQELKAHNEFAEGALVGGLSKTARVVGRLTAAIQIFA